MTRNETDVATPSPGSRLVDRAARRMLGLPAHSSRYRIARGIRVPTRDGFHLITDHYAPATDGAAATILVRGPYGRAFPNSLLYGRIFAGEGFHVLVQSVRGTFGSGDVFQPFLREADDAQDTVSWLRTQPWFDGRLATVGGSYLGFTQWALLADPPAELRAAVIVVGPHDFAAALYGVGAFALAVGFGWSEAIANQESVGRLRGLGRVLSADRRTRPALNGLPLATAAEPFLDGRAPWYREWLEHPDLADPYWDGGHRHGDALQDANVPTLLVGGWHDVFLEQTLEQYERLHERKGDVALTVGPWTHLDTATKASGAITRESLEWLDQHVGGQRTRARTKPVRLFITGAGEWREYSQWPPPTREHTYYPGEASELGNSPGTGTSSFTFDPKDPTPALGGRLLHPRHAGVKDNKELETRPDVLTFTSSPIAADVEIIGRPVVTLALSVDNPHADIFVRLCDVDRRGTSRNIADALVRLDPAHSLDHVQPVRVALDPCAHRVAAGHRLRLQVSGGAHPRYARNLGTDEPLASAEKLNPSVHVVHHADSRVVLPFANAPDA